MWVQQVTAHIVSRSRALVCDEPVGQTCFLPGDKKHFSDTQMLRADKSQTAQVILSSVMSVSCVLLEGKSFYKKMQTNPYSQFTI